MFSKEKQHTEIHPAMVIENQLQLLDGSAAASLTKHVQRGGDNEWTLPDLKQQ